MFVKVQSLSSSAVIVNFKLMPQLFQANMNSGSHTIEASEMHLTIERTKTHAHGTHLQDQIEVVQMKLHMEAKHVAKQLDSQIQDCCAV